MLGLVRILRVAIYRFTITNLFHYIRPSLFQASWLAWGFLFHLPLGLQPYLAFGINSFLAFLLRGLPFGFPFWIRSLGFNLLIGYHIPFIGPSIIEWVLIFLQLFLYHLLQEPHISLLERGFVTLLVAWYKL